MNREPDDALEALGTVVLIVIIVLVLTGCTVVFWSTGTEITDKDNVGLVVIDADDSKKGVKK